MHDFCIIQPSLNIIDKSTANWDIADDRETWEYKGLVWEWDWIERCSFK